MALNIMVVDDEKDIRDLVLYNLKKEGHQVTSFSNGEDALTRIRQNPPDLLILDLMLPGLQGIELCRILRKDPTTEFLPIIMLTAKSEEMDRVVGLEMGADDYITKPFSPRELIARINAVMRRVKRATSEKGRISFGDIEIDPSSYQVKKGDTPVSLSATEFRLLLYLAERKGRVFTRQMLLDAVWKNEAYVEPRTVDVHIRRLRMQIEDDPAHPRYIRTKRGVGYFLDDGS
ncbi:MAG: response regulator [Nitrospirae bacterium]|nr:MAG: response regulator [Nitrospirota bacterium]